jgi:hypothetical protein
MAYDLKDVQLKVTKALPNGAASTTSDGFDLGHGTRGDVVAGFELKITAPALGATPLPDSKTMIFIIEHDTASGFGTVATLLDRVIIQTGAGGAGAAAATKIVKLPVDTNRYVRVKATGSASGDASGSSFTVELLF